MIREILGFLSLQQNVFPAVQLSDLQNSAMGQSWKKTFQSLFLSVTRPVLAKS